MGMGRSLWYDAVRRLKRNKRAMFGFWFIVILVLMATFAPLIAPYDPNDADLSIANQAPSIKHIMGTDRFGRDIFSRVIYGSRVSLKVGIISQSISLLIGIALGSIAGYFRGWVDDVIMWLINVVWAFPALLLVIAITAVLGPGITNVYIAIALVSWVGVARIVRGEVMALREREFVEAARAVGASRRRIIFRHILPNCLGPVIVVMTLGFAGAILAEAGLSFLGLGVQPPTPSWGTMINTGRGYIFSSWWMAVFPGIAITLSVIAFNLFGDGLRDALDPRMRV